MPEPLENDEAFVQRMEAIHQRLMDGSSDDALADDEQLPADVAAALESAEQMFELIERVQRVADHEDTRPLRESTTAQRAGRAVNAHDLLPEIDATEAIGQRIGRFQVRRELGRGGYGLVFLAHDPELDREVALKIPRPEAILTEEMQTRFLREGKAAAMLSHPNIVPVFETGRMGRVCFIVSRYVAGRSLAEWLEARPSPCDPRAAAQLVATLADGVQHAHSKGVIHRDLKPANVLLESDGATDALATPDDQLHQAGRITDFGLAKTTGDANLLTGTGAIIGTPAYMSPEQSQGKHDLVATTDVYSLGAVLYELITGSRPFVAASVIDTLRLVQEREPVPPSRCNRRVDRDLEAICLKCLEKNPQDRYVTAAALQADLNRFTSGEPVLARPVTRRQRLGKWCRRNPLVAGLTAVAALFLCAALVATSVGWWTTANAHATANRRYDQAKSAVNDYFTQVSENKLLTAPGLKPLRQDLLASALIYYQQLLEDQEDDPELGQEIEETHFRIANIQAELGDTEPALRAYENVLRLLERRSKHASRSADLLHRQGRALHQIGVLQLQLGQPEDAKHTIDRGIQVLQTAAEMFPQDLSIKEELAGSHHQKGFIFRSQGKPSDAVAGFQASLALREEICAADPGNSQHQSLLAKAQGDLANLLRRLGRVDEAQTLFVTGMETFRRLVEEDPSNWNDQQALAASLINLSLSHAMTGQLEQGIIMLEEAVDIFQRLSLVHPQVAEYRSGYAFATNRLGLYINSSGDAESAVAPMRVAQDLYRRQLDEHPDVVANRTNLAENQLNLGSIFAELARFSEAIAELSSALESYELLAEKLPDDIEGRLGRAVSILSLGLVADQQNDHEQALDKLCSAIELLQSLHQDHPQQVMIRREWARACSQRASLLDRLDRSDEALADREVAIQFCLPPELARYRLELAMTLARTGEPKEALDLIEEVVANLGDGRTDLGHLGLSYAAVAYALEADAAPADDVKQLVDQSAAALEQAAQGGAFQKHHAVNWLNNQPEFHWISDHPRFATFLAELESSNE